MATIEDVNTLIEKRIKTQKKVAILSTIASSLGMGTLSYMACSAMDMEQTEKLKVSVTAATAAAICVAGSAMVKIHNEEMDLLYHRPEILSELNSLEKN